MNVGGEDENDHRDSFTEVTCSERVKPYWKVFGVIKVTDKGNSYLGELCGFPCAQKNIVLIFLVD